MGGARRAAAPRSWLRLPRRTARLRLTLLYSGMFLGLGTALIVAIFLLSSSREAINVTPTAVRIKAGAGGGVSASKAALAAAAAIPGVPDPMLRRHVLKGIVSGANLQHSADLAQLLGTSWLLLALTAVISAFLGWFASGRVLRPLRQMADTARTISAGNLGQRLALRGPDDEFKRLGDTLDDLLARLEASFDAQRRFVANASHELRTPLTVERTLLQVALADPDATAASLRGTCTEILAYSAEQERLLESLLTLATSERGLMHHEPVDLARLARHVVLSPRADLQRAGLALETTLEAATVSGDAALLERLMANLVDNAVRYNRPGGRIEVRTAAIDGRAVVSVTNTGPLVPAAETERMFEPFQRLGGGRAAGADGHHGLGLSIVRAIAAAHHAAVDATPQPAGGLAITVTFTALRERAVEGPP